MKRIAYILILVLAPVLVQGCTTRVRYTPNPATKGVVITANTRVDAAWSRAADGGESFSINTSQQNWLDKIRAGMANVWNWLGRRLDTTSAAIGK